MEPKLKQVLIISLIFISSLQSSKTITELLETISKTKSQLNYFFFMENYEAFLVRETQVDTNTSMPKKVYQVWNYTQERKWKPISNTKEYDGYQSSINHFTNIAINKEDKTISFGSIINYNNALPYNTSTKKTNTNHNILPLLQTIENKTISIGWYFWNVKDDFFLFKGDNEKGIKIWNYTQNREWRPLYNTDGFDRFKEAGDTLKDVRLITDTSNNLLYINIGDINENYKDTQDGFIVTIKSDKLKVDGILNYRNITYILPKYNYVISKNNQYTILTDPLYNYDYSVDCNNDGRYEAEHLDGNYTCEYKQVGEYDILIDGIYPSRGIVQKEDDNIYSDNGKVIEIKQWGNIQWKNMANSFMYSDKLIISAKDKPNLSQLTDMHRMFYLSSINQDISQWDVSSATNMSEMFSRSSFNNDISQWDVSNVTNMSGMFSSSSFNNDISQWDVSSVLDMNEMFYGEIVYVLSSEQNSPISAKGVRESGRTPFNQDISQWDVSNVTNMSGMFSGSSFNKNISQWDMSSVINMIKMFYRTTFDKDISQWNVSSVKRMDGIFLNSIFNQDISNWDVSSAINMSEMFSSSLFNQDISNWDVSSAINVSEMFASSPFNQDISQWDVSNAIDMNYMFYRANNFNQNISQWDVSKVETMKSMFKEAVKFNQDLTQWQIKNNINSENIFQGATLMEEKNKPKDT